MFSPFYLFFLFFYSELIIVAVDCSFVQLLRNAVPLDIRKKRKNLLDLFFLSWDLLGATLCFCMLVSKVLERRRKLCDYKFVLLHASTGMNFIDNKNLNLNYI